MRPVFQDQFGAGHGNCLSACVASLLSLPLSEVPNFCAEVVDANGLSWMERLGLWLHERGYGFVHMPWGSKAFVYGAYVIACGKSPRCDVEDHAVIAEAYGERCEDGEDNGEPCFNWNWGIKYVHDPHPDGGYLLGEPKYLLVFSKRRV